VSAAPSTAGMAPPQRVRDCRNDACTASIAFAKVGRRALAPAAMPVTHSRHDVERCDENFARRGLLAREPAGEIERRAIQRRGERATVKKRGRSLTVDIHCHYMNSEVATKVAPLNPAQHEPMALYSNAATREVNARQVQERGPKLTDIAVRLKDMDRMGIDIQAVSPAPHQTYYWTDPGMGAELARAVNERLAEIVAQHPDRFVALGTVPLQDSSLAIAELEHCVRKLGMRGVEINPSVKGMDLTDAKLALDKFFAAVQA